MKKERMYELMTELRDRQFGLEECYELFNDIHWYLDWRERYMNAIGTDRDQHGKEWAEHEKALLEKRLHEMGLDYTIDEFITED